MRAPALAPTVVEVATGLVIGTAGAPLPEVDPSLGPAEAFDRVLLPALRRPPCLVSFSGGRDSSLVLAAAVRVARREGLDPPVPLTVRYPATVATVETDWQELVVRHLGLDDWEIWEPQPGDYDFVGPLARATLRRHGVLFPPNAFVYAPRLAAARNGSLLTGVGGDYVLGHWPRQRVADVLGRRVRPTPRDALRMGAAWGPRAFRRRLELRRAPQLDWVREPARARRLGEWADEAAREPWRWDRRTHWRMRRRNVALVEASLDLLAREAGALIVHPFYDRGFAGALARAGGATGFGDRTALMEHLTGDLLPRAVVERRTKALFFEVFWSDVARAFARDWDGSGVPRELVDVETLRIHWGHQLADTGTAMLLHSAWLASVGEEPHQPADGLV